MKQIYSFGGDDDDSRQDSDGDDHDDEDELGSVVGSDDELGTAYTTQVKEMLTIYERQVKVLKSQTMKAEILRHVRRLVIPCEKFIAEGKYIGSFERPDFTDVETWYAMVLQKAGYDKYKPRSLAKIWVTYRSDISEAFSNHRSYATQTMKTAFLVGEYLALQFYHKYNILISPFPSRT